MGAKMNFVAKTFAGLEGVLSSELAQLGAEDICAGRRAVSFSGDKALLYKANMHCRTALRILRPIVSFEADGAEEIYEKIKEIAWEDFIGIRQTFLIEATIYSSVFRNSRFATYRMKDAIVDRFNEKFGRRPSISVANPDIYLNLHIAERTVTISLDSSGEPLYKRGYRVAQTEAPINEVLAAGMVLLSGWDGQTDFLDPMCGSGTIAIEAAMIALNMAPGLFRKHFAFENWNDFDRDLFDEIYNDDTNEREFNHRIMASDIDATAVAIAEANVKAAGLSKYVSVTRSDFFDLPAPSEDLCIITNPPYGERLKTDVDGLYSKIGQTLKHKYSGCEVWIISSNLVGFDKIGLKPSGKYLLVNGDLDCQFRHYRMFSGKLEDFKSNAQTLGVVVDDKPQKFVPEPIIYKGEDRTNDFKSCRVKTDDEPRRPRRAFHDHDAKRREFSDRRERREDVEAGESRGRRQFGDRREGDTRGSYGSGRERRDGEGKRFSSGERRSYGNDRRGAGSGRNGGFRTRRNESDQ